MPELKKKAPVLYTLEEGKLFAYRNNSKDRELVCDNRQGIPVAGLIVSVCPDTMTLNGGQTFQLAKTASCGFIYPGRNNVWMVATRAEDLFDLSDDTIDEIRNSMSFHNIDETRMTKLTYINWPTELHFTYEDDRWTATRIKKASAAEINFLYNILVKYDLI